jgi:hypothetical protein
VTTPRWTSYDIEGRLLDVSGSRAADLTEFAEDPDGDFLGWYIDRGVVRGVDVSDRCICASVSPSRDVFAGNWMARTWTSEMLVDDRCSEGQQAALLSVFTGQLGGPMADLAVLIGEVVAVRRVPVTFGVAEDKGFVAAPVSRRRCHSNATLSRASKAYIKIGDVVEARLPPPSAAGARRSFRLAG